MSCGEIIIIELNWPVSQKYCYDCYDKRCLDGLQGAIHSHFFCESPQVTTGPKSLFASTERLSVI